MYLRGLHLLVFIFSSLFLSAQSVHFHAPVDIPIQFTGSFGELRGTHFHSGIDIRTNGQIGLPLYSAESGHVSRVSVSPTGFGLALYIAHHNGYTTVYGHMDRFAPRIAEWVKAQQYQKKRFALDVELSPEILPVEKGEMIGWSGNSGSSGGPHLHYEIRNTQTNRSLNPAFFGFQAADTKSPVFNFVHVYPISNDSHIDGSLRSKRYKTVLSQGAYQIEGRPTLSAFGEIGFGVDVTDYLDANWSKCGIYSLELRVDSVLIHRFSLDSFNFNLSSHFNSHIDYAYKVRGGNVLHRNFTDHGNKLEIYDINSNRGIIDIEQGKSYTIEYLIADAAGNKSVLRFSVKGTNPVKRSPKPEPLRKFRYSASNSYRDEQLAITIPEGSLFDNLDFQYRLIDSVPPWAYSPIHVVHEETIPLAKPFNLALKPYNLPDFLTSKALIVKLEEKTNRRSSVGGTFKNGWVETNSRSFGRFCITIDTTPPVIVPLSIKDKNALTEPNRIRFRITDNLSGIDQYNGFIDDEWVLFEYDAKSNTITYQFDEKLVRGKRHTILLKVSDTKGNEASFSGTFWK